MAIMFKTTNDNRYFEDYIPGDVHEFGSIKSTSKKSLNSANAMFHYPIMSTKKR